MSISVEVIAAVLNRTAGFEKVGGTSSSQGIIKHFPHGILGVVVETPEYDGDGHKRTDYSLLYRGGNFLMYVNIHPQHVQSVDSVQDPVAISLSEQHPGGGGHYTDRKEALKILHKHDL